MIARRLAASARRNHRWARPWFRPRGHAPLIMPMAAISRNDRKPVRSPTRSASRRWRTQSSEEATDGTACRDIWELSLPASSYDRITLGHGGGGLLSSQLISRLFLPAYGNDVLAALEDQAIVGLPSHNGTRSPRIAITTDSFVVRPLFFPGGDIGKLAVHGTVNDLAVGGAMPLYLTAAFILEEGLAITELERIALSMRQACADAGVVLVAGDTKVVDRGKGDGVFITTTGVGVVPQGRSLSIALPVRATRSWCRARLATMALPSCRFARGSSLRPCSKATRPP